MKRLRAVSYRVTAMVLPVVLCLLWQQQQSCQAGATGAKPSTKKTTPTKRKKAVKSVAGTGNRTPINPRYARLVSADKFQGEVRKAYEVAHKIPEILDQLFCYCGCDITDAHCTLLDCYLSNHSVDCNECKGEAMMSSKMHSEGATIDAIRQKLHENWKKHYIFKSPTPAYKRYLDEHKLDFDHCEDPMDIPAPGTYPESSCCGGKHAETKP